MNGSGAECEQGLFLLFFTLQSLELSEVHFGSLQFFSCLKNCFEDNQDVHVYVNS